MGVVRVRPIQFGLLLFVPVLLFSSCAQYEDAQAMMKAVRANQADKVLALLARDASLANIPLKGGGSRGFSLTSEGYATTRPLYAAAEAGHVDMVRLLLDRGANIEATAYSGQTALHVAATSLRVDVIALLLDRGARVNALDRTRSTALHYAVQGHAPDVPRHVTLLIERGAAIDARDEEGRTPFHRAAMSAPVASALCAAGADPAARDRAGQTVADLARQAKDPAFAAWLDSADGCRGLAEAHARGEDVGADRQRVSAKLYACQKGEFDECSSAGYAFDVGKGVTVNHRRAAELYRKACDGGHTTGCSNLGICYRDGEGVPEDAVRAVALFRKACEAGNASGCGALGYQFERGLGVAHDAVQAVASYRKSCDLDDGYGCYRLALSYEAGRGVPADPAQAQALRQKACKAGHADACGEAGLHWPVQLSHQTPNASETSVTGSPTRR
jgi:TPR repeat protein